MRDGFFPLHRKFFDHWLWKEDRTFSRAEAWLDMMTLACIAPTKRVLGGIVYSLDRGQLSSSERVLSQRWGWSRTKLRAFLSALESDAMIVQKKDRETTILTLCNYERYALGETGKEPRKDHEKTTKEPRKDQIGELENGKRTGEQLFADGLFPPENEKKERRGTVTDTRPGQVEIEAYAIELGLPATDGEHMFNTWESKNWKDVKNWQATFRQYKTGGWLPSQKAKNGYGPTTTGGLDKSRTIPLRHKIKVTRVDAEYVRNNPLPPNGNQI